MVALGQDRSKCTNIGEKYCMCTPNKSTSPISSVYDTFCKRLTGRNTDRRAGSFERFRSHWIRADDVTSSGEACLHPNGYIKRHNTVYWVQDNRLVAVDASRQTNTRKTVSWVIHRKPVLGTLFVEGRVNAERYLQLLNECWNRVWIKWPSHYDVRFTLSKTKRHFISLVRC